LSGRDDISLSAKHFPLCKDCNAFARERNVNPHPNACWAARAAETAGILRGNDGFWQMHFWLFERRGSFTDAELRAGLTTLGYDPDEFIRTMQSPRTLELVQADIAEAMDLGIHYTPMIFINGVEMRGWTVPGALARTVAEVTASRPVAAGPDADRPPTAADKHVGDWRNSPPKAIAPDEQGWPLGPDDAAVRVVVWSDLQVPMTAELDAGIRRLVGERADTRYEYRHYPVDQACNPSSSRTMYPLGCRAAAAAEAAGRLGGADAYWRMHDWLLANRDRVGDDAALRAAATACGLAPDALLAEMETDEVRRGILRDALAGQSAGLRGVPTVFVNGRFVPRFRLEGDDVMRRIVEAAAAGDS
ncbi:MAG: DsbA family protein, partial [Planctomycetota bacterium]